MPAYTNNITTVVSDANHIELVSTALKEYELVTGAKINKENQWTCRSVSGEAGLCWTDGLVKFLQVWFASDLQVNN